MPRAIQTESLHAAGDSADVDSYLDKVVKYVPSDVIAAWMTASTILKGQNHHPSKSLLWIVFSVGLVACCLWTYGQIYRTQKDKMIASIQTVVSSLAFIVWVYAFDGPFPDLLGWYRPYLASLILIGFTLLAGAIPPDIFNNSSKARNGTASEQTPDKIA